MNLLNLIEDITTGHDNLRALMQAGQSGQDAVLNIGGETVTLDPMETRWMFGKYKAFNKAGRQEEFLNHLADPVKFDQHMKQLRQLIDKQKNFQGSVPGQRGVTGDTMPGQMEEDQAVEEIAMQDPNNMSAQTRGKLNWENMIRDYMGNKPYTEFEFGGDRPLTLYRTQVYAILKAFGNMKPQNKVNIILNTFGDKMATVDYLDKLRAKGMMPKKVPAYVAPGTEPVPPGQMSLPGMDAPKIREADDQKKNPKTTELDGAVNPRVARAMQLARARQSAAGTDTEAMVADFVDQQEKDQAEFNKVKSVNQRQDDLLKQVTAVNQQQDQEINSLDSDNADLQNNLQQLQAVNADLAKKLADVSQRRADRQPEPQAPAPSTSTPAQPTATAEPPLQQPATTAQPAPATKKKATTRKKSSATKVQRPQQDIPNNVLPFRRPEPAVAQDEVSAALQGVDMNNELGTGTFGLKENTETLSVGDPVIISGNVEFNGKTGDVVGFGRDQHFVIVDLYNFGKHAFHASNVEYNNYADEEDNVEEMQTHLDRYNVNQPTPGGSNKQREAFLDARDRLFRQMQSASPGEKEAIRLKIADLEGQAQSQGIKIRETGEFNRSGYNAIKSLSDWAEKMRVVRELQKDIALMSDPESKAAVQQRIGDLLKIGIKQGYIKEALNDKAMSVLRSLQQPAPAAVDLNVPASAEPQIDLATVRKKIAQLDELIRMKEQIDRLFLKAQNVRGGIYPGLQSDIEDEELYGVPQTDRQFQDLQDKYTKDLAALQKFLAMKKAVYREGQDTVSESSALVRLKQARQALSQQGLNEYAPGQSGGGSGNYFQALASAWYNGAFDTGSLQKGIKSKEDVERLLNRGIIGPDGVTRKYAIDYNSDFDGVVISSDDYYEHSDYNDQGQEVDSRNGQPWGPNDYMEFSDDDLSESVSEGGPYDLPGIDYPRPGDTPRRPKPQGGTSLRRHPDDPDFMDPDQRRLRADQERVNKAWAEKNKGVAEAQTDYQRRRQRERDVDAGRPVKPLPKNPQTDYAKKRAKDRRDMELGEEQVCSECGGPAFSDLLLAEKQDACYNKVKSRYKVWPSAYASGALVQCRKKGADNWGNKKK
jgi:hypothetical protein